MTSHFVVQTCFHCRCHWGSHALWQGTAPFGSGSCSSCAQGPGKVHSLLGPVDLQAPLLESKHNPRDVKRMNNSFFFLSSVFIYPSNRAESNQFNRNRWFYFLPGSQRIRGGTSLDGRPGSAGLYPYWRSGKPKAASPFHCAVSQMTKRPTLIQYWKSPTDTPYLRPSGYLLIYY